MKAIHSGFAFIFGLSTLHSCKTAHEKNASSAKEIASIEPATFVRGNDPRGESIYMVTCADGWFDATYRSRKFAVPAAQIDSVSMAQVKQTYCTERRGGFGPGSGPGQPPPPVAPSFKLSTATYVSANGLIPACSTAIVSAKTANGALVRIGLTCVKSKAAHNFECNAQGLCSEGADSVQVYDGDVFDLKIGAVTDSYNKSDCDGTPVATGCWYIGQQGQSCTAVCQDHKRVFDELTVDYAGSSGSEEHCKQVGDALIPNIYIGNMYVQSSDFGCAVSGNSLYRASNVRTTADAVWERRICACKKP